MFGLTEEDEFDLRDSLPFANFNSHDHSLLHHDGWDPINSLYPPI